MIIEKYKEKEISPWTKSLEKVYSARDPGLQKLVEILEKKWTGEDKDNIRQRNIAHVVKPANVPTWTNDMTLDTFVKQMDIWKASNAYVMESTLFQDFVESLKRNKDIRGLQKYFSEYIITTLNTVNKQVIKEVLDCLKDTFGQTRLEQLEELVTERR